MRKLFRLLAYMNSENLTSKVLTKTVNEITRFYTHKSKRYIHSKNYIGLAIIFYTGLSSVQIKRNCN
jgi:predicted TPR repeat methyltransferase